VSGCPPRAGASDVEWAVRLGPLGGDVRVEVWLVRQRGVQRLPIVDDVPRTAEVVSKVVLLAPDERMPYPTIREQLRV
jgi:hypothetical protein